MSLCQRPSLRPLRRAFSLKTAIQLFGATDLQYLVLENTIKTTLARRSKNLSSQIEVFEHPIPAGEGAWDGPPYGPPIRFGFLGLANLLKGFPIFVRLAAEATQGQRCRAEFHAVGSRPLRWVPPPGLEALKTKPCRDRLPRRVFVEAMKSLHYVVCPYDRRQYEVTCSGTVLDAVAWCKPLLAFDLPVFRQMFQDWGDIGYLVRDYSELRDTIATLIENPNPARYREQRHNLQRLRSAREPESLASKFRSLRQQALELW